MIADEDVSGAVPPKPISLHTYGVVAGILLMLLELSFWTTWFDCSYLPLFSLSQ